MQPCPCPGLRTLIFILFDNFLEVGNLILHYPHLFLPSPILLYLSLCFPPTCLTLPLLCFVILVILVVCLKIQHFCSHLKLHSGFLNHIFFKVFRTAKLLMSHILLFAVTHFRFIVQIFTVFLYCHPLYQPLPFLFVHINFTIGGSSSS